MPGSSSVFPERSALADLANSGNVEVTLSQKPEGSWVRDVEVRLNAAQERAKAAEGRIDLAVREGDRKGREAGVQRQRAKVAEERVKVFKAQAAAADARTAATQVSLNEAREEWSKQQVVGRARIFCSICPFLFSSFSSRSCFITALALTFKTLATNY